MNKTVKYTGFSIFLILGVVIGVMQIFQPVLDAKGNLTLMMLIITIALWIFKPFNLPFSVSGGLFMASLLVLGVPAANVFSGFSGTAVWTLIPALFFGFVLAKTGLGRRIAYFGMKSIKVSYPGLLMMWFVIGVGLSILTPSITVRVVIVTPIALQCAQICQLPKGSKARSLVLITAWAMAMIPGVGWLTGSLSGPVISGFYASIPELGAIDFSSWAKVSLLPTVLISLLTVIFGYFVLKPAEKLTVTKEVFVEEYRKLGRTSGKEIITGIVLIASFLCFTTNSLHHIPDAAVCLTGLFILTLTGVIETKELSSGISWDLVLFIGTAMGFGSVFAVTGVSSWMSGILIGAIAPISSNPWVFVYVVLFVMFVWRFVDIAVFIPTIAIVSAISPEVFSQYGINPLVWVPLLCIGQNAFFLSYTNMFALVGEANLGDEGWTPDHLAKYGTVYFVVAMLAMVVAVPYWISIDMFW
ncbi:MAG: anion permease [Oscillospiraceae bacterium]|jgi:anion transporter|nr:anion permease [Oscillospiraceae bacterium]